MPGLHTTVTQRCLPLAYSFVGHEPEKTISCDAAKCDVVAIDSEVLLLTCGHTFHVVCMAKTELCSICQPLLEETLKKLADAFNRGLLTDDKPTADEVNEDATDSSADSSDDDSGGDDEGDSSLNTDALRQLKQRLRSPDFRKSLAARLDEVHALPETPSLPPAFPNKTAAPHLTSTASTASTSAPTNAQCPQCGKAYKTIRGLAQHQRLTHKQ